MNPFDASLSRRQFAAGLTTLAAASLAAPIFAASGDKRWRVGVIGHTGKGDYGHGLDTMWLKLPETEIVAVADAEAKGLPKAQERLGLKTGYTDYKKMLAEAKPDIVVVGPRQIELHRDMAMAAIQAGAKGIYMEKPFVPTLAEADEVVAACEKHNVKLSIAHRNRFHPALPVIEKMIADGVLGRVLEIRGRGKEDARGGMQDLWVLGTHVLNVAVYYTGAPTAVTASIYSGGKLANGSDTRQGSEGVGLIMGDEVHARLETERGIPIYFDSIVKAGDAKVGFGLQIVGTKGIVDLRMDAQPIAYFMAGSPFQPVKEARQWVEVSTAGAGQPEPIKDLKVQAGGHLIAGRDLIAAIKENREPLCSAKEGRVTVEMVTGVIQSHLAGGQRITLPLKNRINPLKT